MCPIQYVDVNVLFNNLHLLKLNCFYEYNYYLKINLFSIYALLIFINNILH